MKFIEVPLMKFVVGPVMHTKSYFISYLIHMVPFLWSWLISHDKKYTNVVYESWISKKNSCFGYILVNKDFLTWLLIGWQQSCQPIKSQVLKFLLMFYRNYMDFNMEIFF